MSELNGVVEDVLGNAVNPGDTVAGAFRIGNTAVLRVGTVLGFGERANKLTVKVKWQVSSREYEREITGSIEAELNRFVKLDTPVELPAVDVVAPEVAEVNDEVPVVNP